MLVYKLPSDRSRNSRKSFPLSIDIIPTFRKKTATLPLLAAGVCLEKTLKTREIHRFFLSFSCLFLSVSSLSSSAMLFSLCYCRYPHLLIQFVCLCAGRDREELLRLVQLSFACTSTSHTFLLFFVFLLRRRRHYFRRCNQLVISFWLW